MIHCKKKFPKSSPSVLRETLALNLLVRSHFRPPEGAVTLSRHSNRCHWFSASQGPVDPEGSTAHAQEQGHLQEDQQQEVGAAQQEVDAAQRGPLWNTGTVNRILRETPWSLHPRPPELRPRQSTRRSPPDRAALL